MSVLTPYQRFADDERDSLHIKKNYHSLCTIGVAFGVGSGALESESFSFIEIYFRTFHLAILTESLLLDGGEFLHPIGQSIEGELMIAEYLILIHHLLRNMVSLRSLCELSVFGDVDALVDAQPVLVLQVQQLA